MATIRFLSPDLDRTVTLPSVTNPADAGATDAGGNRSLLSVARDAGIPLMFNCETGDCAACLVHVETLAEGSQAVAPPTRAERFLLQAMGLLTTAEVADADSGHAPAGTRLACQYEIRDESIVVQFSTGMSSLPLPIGED